MRAANDDTAFMLSHMDYLSAGPLGPKWRPQSWNSQVVMQFSDFFRVCPPDCNREPT